MKNLCHIIFSICCLMLTIIGTCSLKAQTNSAEDNSEKYIIAVQPFLLMNGGLRVDFETRLKNPKSWLQVSLTGYRLPYYNDDEWGGWENFNSDFDLFRELKGLGIGGAYKYLLYKDIFYASAGLSYTYFEVTYQGGYYNPYQEDGLTFYEYSRTDRRQYFNKLYSNICVGLQTYLSNALYGDAYIGLGYSYSFYDKEKAAFDDSIFGYGRRGLTVAGGVRIGVAF